MAEALKDAEILVSSSGQGLKNVYTPGMNTLGQLMFDAGWSRGHVAVTLDRLFDATAEQIATFVARLSGHNGRRDCHVCDTGNHRLPAGSMRKTHSARRYPRNAAKRSDTNR